MADSGVEGHYSSQRVFDAVTKAVEALGKPIGTLSVDDTAPFDEFHVCGRKATAAAAAEASFSPGDLVLDVGCGLGGPSRYLASTYGCFVTGIDRTLEFCRTAAMLSRWCGLEVRTGFVHGDALSLPVLDSAFDGAWTQHVSMNVADKDGFFRSIARAMKPGAKLVFHEIVAGEGGAVRFPVPWASRPDISHLVTLPRLLEALAASDLQVVSLTDEARASIEFLESSVKRASERGLESVPMSLIIGQDTPTRLSNVAQGLSRGALGIVRGLAVRR